MKYQFKQLFLKNIVFAMGKAYSIYMYDPNAVKIYTDGSAMPNPGKGGIGIVIDFPDQMEKDWEIYSIGFRQSTNNRMELSACIEGIKWLNTYSPVYKFNRAILITDSEYVHKNYKNIQYWKINAWKNKEGRPYENVDLWATFLKEKTRIHIPLEILWEKGKMRLILNEVDRQAKLGAKNPTKDDFGYRPGKFTATKSASKKAASLYNMAGRKITIRVYKKSSDGAKKPTFKISFDLYDNKDAKYSGKYYAYITNPEIILRRNNCYEVSIELSSTFPIIKDAERIEYLK